MQKYIPVATVGLFLIGGYGVRITSHAAAPKSKMTPVPLTSMPVSRPTTFPQNNINPPASNTKTPTTPKASSTDPVIAAAGDIACALTPKAEGEKQGQELCQMQATSDLLLETPLAAVLPLGDTQYEEGALEQFQKSYAPSWGRVKNISHPAVGNHEYGTANAAGYFGYFGSLAGDKSKGYYSYDLGQWHLIALNGNCKEVGGCQPGSSQETWLKADLAAHPTQCTLAYWHQPRFSSALHGNNTDYETIWQDLYQAGVELVLNGHDHDYERFAPQTPDGRPDSRRGIREFVVGTGGESLYPFMSIQPNSEVRNNQTYGVLKLTLHPTSYSWQFVPQKGKTFTDAGQDICH